MLVSEYIYVLTYATGGRTGSVEIIHSRECIGGGKRV